MMPHGIEKVQTCAAETYGKYSQNKKRIQTQKENKKISNFVMSDFLYRSSDFSAGRRNVLDKMWVRIRPLRILECFPMMS
jgi:hypothetical protein